MDAALTEISPDLRLIVSNRAKRMTLRLDSKKREIRLTIPKRASMRKARKFALNHQEWIRDQIANLPAQIPFSHDSVIPVLGQNRQIKITYDNTLRLTNISLNNNELLVSTYLENSQGRIVRFLKEHARKELSERAHAKAELINQKIAAIQIRDTKSRWGSCGHDKRLSFSWRLILAPLESLDYVVAHEVAHLVHMNHTKDFWDLCTELSTDLSTGKGWMKKNGNSLMRYG